MIRSRSRQSLLSLLLVLVSIAALPSAAGAVMIGVSDQTAGMFSDAHFKRMKLQTARITVSWDVMDGRHGRELGLVKDWLAAAARDKVSPLVSIGADALHGNNVPSLRSYAYWVQRFITRFRAVKTYTAWNEPDWQYRTAVANHPELAAGYFNWLFVHCHRCTVVAGDFSDAPAYQLWPYARAYSRDLRHRPAAWAVHNYLDIRTHTTNVVGMMLRLTRRPIWLTEVGGVERRGHWPYANQNAAAAGRDEAFLFSLPKRFRRIARIYHYQWRDYPAAPWDSGLLGPKGELRPAYHVIADIQKARRH